MQRAYHPAADFRLGCFGLDTASTTASASRNDESDFALAAPKPATPLAGRLGVVPLSGRFIRAGRRLHGQRRRR